MKEQKENNNNKENKHFEKEKNFQEKKKAEYFSFLSFFFSPHFCVFCSTLFRTVFVYGLTKSKKKTSNNINFIVFINKK